LRTVSVGVVGCGRNSDNHLRVYAHTPNVRLVSVCDAVEANAKEKANKYGAERTFTNSDAMMKLDLDLVDVITPTPTHRSLVINALESGHDVLVEKPMALTLQECQDMITASRRSGRSLSVCHNKRFYESVVQTKHAIQDEKLTVSRMRFAHFFVFGYMRPSWILTEESGGVLWEAMVHHAYMLEHFLGRIDRVYAVARKVRNPVYDSLTLLTQSQGRPGLGEYERYSSDPLLGFQIFTDEGIRYDGDLFEDYVLRRPPHRRPVIPRTLARLSDDLAIPIHRWRSRTRRSVRQPSYGVVTPYKRTFYALIRQYVSYLLGERTSPPVMAEEGLRAIRVLESAKKSLETYEPQTIPD
jgi:predicted dehydrogenase